jgi:hypothetical protein
MDILIGFIPFAVFMVADRFVDALVALAVAATVSLATIAWVFTGNDSVTHSTCTVSVPQHAAEAALLITGC